LQDIKYDVEITVSIFRLTEIKTTQFQNVNTMKLTILFKEFFESEKRAG